MHYDPYDATRVYVRTPDGGVTVPEPWLIHFFQRHQDDDPARPTPTIEFLDGLPDKIAAQIQAVLEAVAAAPPPSFSGGQMGGHAR